MKPIDFSYSFAPPNRLTVCQPDSSQKLLCDCMPEGFVAAWSEKAVKDVEIDGLFEPLPAAHKIRFHALCDGEQMTGRSWRRLEDWLPVLDYTFAQDECTSDAAGCTLRCQVAAGRTGDIFKVIASNPTGQPHTLLFKTRCTSLFNRLWTQRGSEHNAMTGNMHFPPNRIVLYSPMHCEPSDIFNIELMFQLEPGQTAESFVIRPYNVWMDRVQTLADTDWHKEFEDGLAVWRTLIGQAAEISLPDPALQNVYRACLADMFVMREPQKSGHVVALCGTEVYRCTNPCEPLTESAMLVKLGYREQAKDGMMFSLGQITEDGNWNEPDGWPHDGWVSGGFKSLAVLEYYRHTGDRAFLEEQFERMLASARYNERVRQTTKTGPWTPVWGLMPRGIGDGGLKDGDDMYGVFYPHNFYCCAGAGFALEAAEILGRTDVTEELRAIYEDYKECIKKSLEVGAITDPDGVRWIGGVANKTSGSRWAAVDAAYPCGIYDAQDPLIAGTVRAVTRNSSEGGLPLDLGWMKGGIWAAIAIDSLTYVNILRGQTQQVMDYLYAVANHATPLVTWCEERKPEPQAVERTGDIQHSWTPLAVCKTVVASMAFSYRDTLYMACGIDRDWIAQNGIVSVEGLGTHWGPVSFRLETGKTMRLSARLHDRLPEMIRTRGGAVCSAFGCECTEEDGWIVIRPQSSEFTVEYTALI